MVVLSAQIKAVGFCGIMPRIVVKVFCWIAPKWNPRKLMNINHFIGTRRVWQRAIPGQVRRHCFACVVFVLVWIKRPFCCVSFFNGSPCCLQTEPMVCPWWCWMQASHGGGHVLLTRGCSYGNTAGSAGLCIQPVCQFDSKHWFPVITRTHSSLRDFLKQLQGWCCLHPSV